MSVTVSQLRDFLSEFSEDTEIAIDEGGLALVEVGGTAYYEIGGAPEP